jgi:tetratricopeptide (TPR) repeat protein
MPRAALEAVLRGDATRAGAEARRALAEDPADPGRRAALALALLAGRRPREALPEAEEAARAAPGLPWAARLRAAALREAGRPREAILAADEAVRLFPGSARAHLSRALSLAAAGETWAARAPLERALALAPDDAAAVRLAAELALPRDPAAAEALFRAALRLEPTGAEGRLGLSRALARQGREGEAREAWEAAALRDPSLERDRAARRAALLGALQASAVALLLVVAIGLARAGLAARWPDRAASLGVAAWIASTAVPAALLAWATVRLRRTRTEGPLDPEVGALAEEIAGRLAPAAPVP